MNYIHGRRGYSADIAAGQLHEQQTILGRESDAAKHTWYSYPCMVLSANKNMIRWYFVFAIVSMLGEKIPVGAQRLA